MKVLLTGGHTGIGLELVRRLHQDGATIGLIVRSPTRLEGVPEEIRNAPGFTSWTADLSVHEDLVRVADDIAADWSHIDILYNNAGVLLPELRRSAQGHEMHLQVNALTPYLLTHRLKARLDAAESPLVITTVTGGMHSQSELDLEQLVNPQVFRKLFGQYLQSKLAITLWLNELAASDGWQGVAFRHVNPGANKTSMTAGDGVPWYIKLIRGLVFTAPTKGGNLLYNAAFDPSLRRQSGVYLDEGTVRPVKAILTDAQRTTLMGLVPEATAQG